MGEAVSVAVRHPANYLLAELVGAALKYDADIMVTPASVGRTWAAIMDVEQVSFATHEVWQEIAE